ncbi:hypothetical protein [Martelella mediterranea]|uniref:Uncharacterized protein n=1 Tax=Martelella mediterranea DSM 17316 TaxID=1122214 RepID=A0A1U9Z4S2_9HYPH|nr:hypothetical protein [Martelella mediterranea]AQZ52664.1 hypothetical protein Mame_03357 [Martelella mediterranea DSM 17316]
MSFTRKEPVPVSKNAVIRYLTDQGWQRETSRDGRLVKLSLRDAESADHPIDLIFSMAAEPQHERNEVAAAIDTLTQLYDIPRFQVTQILASIAYDVMLTRVPDEYVRHESVELGTANAYISGMKSFLAASATTEISGEQFFSRTLKEALLYANQCRFGHTFHGSFGFVIESPVGMNDAPAMPIVEESVPFGRKVMRRVSRGLTSFSHAVEQDDPAPLVAPDSGMSANMCDEVVGLIEDTGISKLEMSISFSPEWAPTEGISHRLYKIERRYVDLLKDASARLRKEESPKKCTVIGRIVRLETDGNPADLFGDPSGREITVSWDSADYGPIRMQIPLDPASYLEALEAHRSGQLFSVTGLLKRKGRGWLLEEAHNPRLIS